MKNPIVLFLNECLQFLSFRLGWAWNPGCAVLYNIESTNACPMTCRMCPRRHMTRPIGRMDPELFTRVVREAAGATEFVWLDHFGDPLLHPELESLIAIAYANGIRVGFSTNPALLAPERGPRLIAAGLDWIHFSLDGTDRATYAYYRGEHADYDKAVRAIEAFLEAKQRAGGATPRVTVAMIRMEKTEPQWDAFQRLWTRPGVDKVMLKTFSSFSGNDASLDRLASGPRETDTRTPCFFPWSSLTVMSDGRVTPCCYDYDGLGTLGDATRETLAAVWNSEAMRRLRRAHLVGDLSQHPLCQNCKDRRRPWTLREVARRAKYRIRALRSGGDLRLVYQ